MASTTARVIAGSTTRATRPAPAARSRPVGSACAELMLPRARESLDDGHGPVEGVPKGEGDQHGRPEEGRVLRAVVLGGEDEIAEPAGGPVSSTTISPTTASGAATFMPANRNGSATGSLSLA